MDQTKSDIILNEIKDKQLSTNTQQVQKDISNNNPSNVQSNIPSNIVLDDIIEEEPNKSTYEPPTKTTFWNHLKKSIHKNYLHYIFVALITISVFVVIIVLFSNIKKTWFPTNKKKNMNVFAK